MDTLAQRAAAPLQEERPFEEAVAALEKGGRVEELIRLYETRSREVPYPEGGVLLARAGELARGRLRNLERAEELLRRALQLGGDPREALSSLRALFEQKQDAAGLADTLERLGWVSKGSDAAALYLKAADLYENRLGRRDRAILCAQRAAREAPQERLAHRRVRQLFMTERRWLPAFDALERERAALGPAGLADEYAALAEAMLDDPAEHGLAQRALETAKALEPSAPRLDKVQKTLQRFEHTWRDQVRTLRSSSLEERDRKKAARLSLQVAKLFAWYDSGAQGKVKEAVERAFLLWPAMPEGLAFVERMADKSGDLSTALALFEKMANDSKERNAQVELWLRLGTLRLSRKQDKAGALAAFERAATLDPSRPEAVSLAAELLLEAEKPAEAVALFDRHLATLRERGAVLALHLRLGELCQSALKDLTAARGHWEAVLKLDPQSGVAAYALAKMAVAQGSAVELEKYFDLALGPGQPVAARLTLCQEAAQLFEKNGKGRQAFFALARQLSLGPPSEVLISQLGQVAQRAGTQAELAQLLRRNVPADAEAALILWRALATLLQNVLGRPEEARAVWQQVLKQRPNDKAAEEALQGMTGGAGPQKAAASPELPQLRQQAQKLETSGADASELVEVYRRLNALVPEDTQVLERLAVLYTQLNRWEDTQAALQSLAALLPSPEQRQVARARLAQIYAERLGRREEAVDLYLALIAEGVAASSTISALERLGAAGVRSADVARALAPLYEQNGDHQRQAASLLVLLNGAEELEEKKSVLGLLAQVHERHLADARAAFDFYLRGIAADPGDGTFRSEARRLAHELSAQPELTRALLALSAQAEPALFRTLVLEAVDVAQDGKGHADAVRALEMAVERLPEDVMLLSHLVQASLEAKRPESAEGALRKLLLLVPADQKAPLYEKLADVSEVLQRPKEAAQALLEALKAGAEEVKHLPRLALLLEQSGKMAELATVVGRQLELAEQAGDRGAVERLTLKRARVLENAVGNRSEAVKNYRAILETRTSDPDALIGLEKLLQDPQCREEAARALIPAYEALKDHRKLVTALEVVADAVQDPREKVAALKQASYVHLHHLRQPELAFTALVRALRFSPGDGALRSAARKAAEDADALDTFAEVVGELVEEDVGSAKVALHRELADVQERKLNNRSAAVMHLRALLSLEPKNVEALRSLQRLHRGAEEWPALVEVLERLASFSPPDEQAPLYREVALLCESKLNDKERAVTAWRAVADRDPLDREAAARLERLYTEQERPQELAFALELRRAQEGQSPQGREVAFRLAGLRREKLGDPAGALQLYRQILEEDSDHLLARGVLEAMARSNDQDSSAALAILDPVLARSGDHSRRVAIREARMEAALREEKARLSNEIRAIYERDMGQPDLAFMATLKAFASGLDRESLKPDLERLARETHAFEELAAIYEAAAGESGANESEAQVYLRRSAELREQLGQGDEAIRLWKDLLNLAPQDRQALDALGRLYEKAKNARNLSEVYARKAQLAGDPAERLALFLKAGEAYEAAGDDARAIEAFRAALAIKKKPEGLEALDRLFGKVKRFEEQADILAQLAEASAGETRRGYWVRRAQLLEKEGSAADAVAAYAQVLDKSPGDGQAVAALERFLGHEGVRMEAARMLEPVYRSVNDLKKLAELLDLRLTSSTPTKRLELITEIATLREALGQKALAFAARMRAFAEAPDSQEGREELERLAADTGSFEELAAAYEDQLERGVSEALATDLWRRLAILYTDRLSRPEQAVKAWEEVARREPKNLEVLDALARLHQKAHAFKELAQIIRRQVAAEPSPVNQITRFYELAQLAEETLADKALAAQAYSEILSRKPDDANAIKALSKVLTESERYPELGALIVREIHLAEAAGAIEGAAELRVRLGRLKLARLNDPRGALDLFQEVLAQRPGHPGAVGALEEMAKSGSPLRGEAAAALEPIFATEGDHLRLVEMFESRASIETVPQERAALHRKVAELYAGPMRNPAMAFLAATRALREVADDERSLALCLSLSKAADAQDELAEVLEEVGEKAASDDARAAIRRAQAQLEESRGRDAEALAGYQKLLEIIPSDPEGLVAVARLYGKAGRNNELLEVLRRQLAMSEEPAARIPLLHQLGELQAGALKDLGGALATYRRLLDLAPEDAGALEQMDTLCVGLERWAELADVLVRRLSQIGAEASLDLRFRLAEVRETKLADKAGSLELYKEILSAQPEHPGVLGRLEAWLTRDPQAAGVAELLLRAYRAARDVGKLSQLLEARVGLAPDSRERKEMLLELAQLREAQKNPELLFIALYRAFKEDPNDAALRQRMEGAAEAARSYDELAVVYEEELPRIDAAQDAAQVAFKLAETLDTRLRDFEKATEYYEKARSFDAAYSPQVLPSLVRLYGELGQAVALAGALSQLAQLTQDPVDRAKLLFQLGQTAQKSLDDPDRAAEAYEALLELEPGHLPALKALEAIYETAGRQQLLYAALQKQTSILSGAERERVLTRMAQVSTEGLADHGRSIELYRELLQKNPRHEEAWVKLESLLEKAERFEELQALLKQKLERTLDPRELVRLNDRLGQVTWRSLGRAEEAVAYFKAALERDARHLGALEALRDIYETLPRKEDLVTVLRKLVPLQEGAEGVKALRIRMAEVLGGLGRREEALDAARRALEIDPHRIPELERIGQVFAGLRAFGDAVRTLELKSQVYLDQDEREQVFQTLFEIAALWQGPAGKPESAGPVLERVLELDPANKNAYQMITELYSKHNDWRAYAAAVDRYVPQLVTDEEKIGALRELARVREHKLGQKDTAFIALCRALELDPASDSLREEVERLAEETGSYEELAAVYEEVADGVPRGPLAEHLYRVLARVHDEKLNDAHSAEGALRKILEFDPTNAGALETLAGMFGRRGQDREYVVALEQKLEAVASIEHRKGILREIARVYEERVKDLDEAAQTLLRALDLEPDAETLTLLADLYRRQENWEKLAQTLARARDLAPSLEEQARLQNELALVYERELSQDPTAIEAYRQSLEFDPANAEALDALERLYTKLDRPAELLTVYERKLELTEDYRERVKLLFKSAAIWEDKFQNLANADACVEAVLQLDPTSLQAVQTLERLRKAQENWEGLVVALEQHAQLSEGPVQRAEVYVSLGDVFYQHLKLVDRAAASYQAALQDDPECQAAMHALGTLYERSGNWPFALEMLQREAELLRGKPQAVELHHRVGKIYEDMLMDMGSAQTSYNEALKLNPGHLPSLRALRGIQEAANDLDALQRTLLQEAQETDDPQQKAQAFVEVARFWAEKREDRDQAGHYYEEAIRRAPDMLEAAQPLADTYVAREEWANAERMMDVVVERLAQKVALDPNDAQQSADLCRQQYRLGYICEKLQKKEKALLAFEQAYALDSTYLPALEGYGNSLVHAKRYEDALKVYQTILMHHGATLTDLEVVEVQWQIGEIHLALSQPDRAQNRFEKALAIDSAHEPSLRAMVALMDAAGRFDKAAEYRQRLVEALDGDAKFDVYVELGKLAREKLSDAHMAIDAYVGAVKIKPDALDVMDSLYVLYRETRQGQKGADILERMLAQPALRSDSAKAKRVLFALGEIARDELKDPEKALAAFNSALDADPRFIEAFTAIESLLGGQRQWKALEENYARMIQRLPKTDETHVARMGLWRALGDLYLKVLKNNEGALMAYQVMATAMPEDPGVQETFAELASRMPGQEAKALPAYVKALARTPAPGRILSALAEQYAKARDYDAAYLAAQAVAGLVGEAGPGEKEILTKLSPYAKKKEVAQSALTDRLWQMHLLHPTARGPLAQIFGLLFAQAGHAYAVALSHYQVQPKKHRVDIAGAPEYQIHHYRYVARLLGFEALELYSPFLIATRERMAKRSREPAPEPQLGAEVCFTHPVCLKVGGKFFAESGQKEVYYLLGRTLTLARPELILTQSMAPERLEGVLAAAVALSGGQMRTGVPPQQLEDERRLLEKALSEPARAALARLVREYLKVAKPDDVRRYLEAAELTAARAGAFAAGELEAVRKAVSGELGAAYRIQPKEKLRDLMVFSVSDDLRALRAAVGIQLEVGASGSPAVARRA
jgi:tetratricopeptide (TPR) repeat protein